MIEYGYEKQNNGKYMVVVKEGMCFAGLGCYSYDLTKEEAYELAKAYNRAEPKDFSKKN